MNMIIKGLMAALLIWTAAPVFAADNTSDDPKLVVEKAVNGILEVLAQRVDPTKLTEVDRQAIRKKVDGRFDYYQMARGSVGKVWKQQSSERQAAFTEVFRQLLERSYGNRLAAYHGQVVVFKEPTFNKKKSKARVQTEVIDGTKITPVLYSLHKKSGAWQVYDIKIEGVSMVGTFRKDFKSPLKKDGFEGLLQALSDKVKRLKSKDAS